MFWTLILACSEPPPPPPPPKKANSALSAALEAVQSGTPDVTPKEGEPPPTPPASREKAVKKELEPGPCKDAHDAVEAYRERMAGVQASAARASNAANQAAADMNACMYEPDCAADGRKAESLKKDLAQKEEDAAKAADALLPMEARIFELNQTKSAACVTPGDSRRR